MLADIFENFQNMCLEIYELDPARFLTAPWLVWHAVLEKRKVKLYLLTLIDILLVVEELSGNMLCYGSICKSYHQIHERLWQK